MADIMALDPAWIIAGMGTAIVGMAGFFSVLFWTLWTQRMADQREIREYFQGDGRAVVKALTESTDVQETSRDVLERIAAKVDSWSRSDDERVKRCETAQQKWGETAEKHLAAVQQRMAREG